MDLAAIQAAAAESLPMGNGEVTTVPGRTLLIDGDGLAYYCAGSDDTPAGQARINLIEKVESAKRACGAEFVKIFLTGSGSHKGHRYSVARVKPYQGHRVTGQRPKNWGYLRQILEHESVIGVDSIVSTVDLEADDLFAQTSEKLGAINCVVYTQDKDMRMVPGWHLDWVTHVMVFLDPEDWARVYNGKVYGRKWFWLQMLQGDTADNIPGLPFYRTEKGVAKRIGEKGAEKALATAQGDFDAYQVVSSLYRGWYGQRWLVEMMEQAVLLWLRQAPGVFDVGVVGRPMFFAQAEVEVDEAATEIMSRILDEIKVN